MSSSKEMITNQYKQEYFELIMRQKLAALDRLKQQSKIYFSTFNENEELFSLSDQPIQKPKKFKTEEAAPMSDDDFLIAELNGHFR